ncbi:dihydroorotate dehydrogenase [Acuticoccus sp. I52.16.1]|uniref:dihydroorotate dehydrogenase n=1 Tax=Acuticoccus sp. I52.16.1 TaxID=2928472 RepID=UPI001FD3DB75|nr:dihydroorotate dehydrogenase [Acuticoccus sp. I52.16.1]UOM35981.1 dihydroorotate dehydrogenase [Acuticoccus sp. I52.16.1]
MPDLTVPIGAVTLKNPVIPASGTFAASYGRVFDLGRLGALVPKTLMPGYRPGHPPNRLTETGGGLLNAVGIPSDGVEAFLTKTLPAYLGWGTPVIVSISADTAAGFAELIAALEGTGIDAIELNLSCPNLEEGGRSFALDPAASAEVVAACRATALPLWAKLSPNAEDIAAVAAASVEAGADALIVANTLTGIAFRRDGRPALANVTGGLSGMPVKPVNLRCTYQVAQKLPGVPIVGCGGIATLQDALDYMAAGASAVAVGSATFSRPLAMPNLIDALATHCTARGIAARDLPRRA